jgi:hypothetical protein
MLRPWLGRERGFSSVFASYKVGDLAIIPRLIFNIIIKGSICGG